MTPWDLVVWAIALGACLLILALAAGLSGQLIRHLLEQGSWQAMEVDAPDERPALNIRRPGHAGQRV